MARARDLNSELAGFDLAACMCDGCAACDGECGRAGDCMHQVQDGTSEGGPWVTTCTPCHDARQTR